MPASAKSTQAAASPAAKNGAVPAGAKSQAAADQVQTAPRVQVKESFMNHLSNRLGDALRMLAKGLMSIIVSIFNSLIS
ncbi:hypothetical protein D3C81_2159280 [compost metagenome]